MPRFQGRLAFKIILPFALLTLVMGAIGTLAATSQLSARNQEAFDAQLIHDGFTAQAMTRDWEAGRLSTLHLLSTSPGLVAAWSQPASLQSQLERALTVRPDTVVETVDPYGRELVGVTGHGPSHDSVTVGRDLSGWSGLRATLFGGSGNLDLVAADPDPTAFSGVLLRDAQGRLLGAVLVGDPLSGEAAAVRSALHDDATFYDPSGQALQSW